MTQTVDAAFSQLDSSLNLDLNIRKKAQTRHADIRDELVTAGVIVASFLQGSFARKTMLKPLKDVDIVCLLDLASWEQLNTPDGPGRAMNSFKAPIRQRWPEVEFDAGDEPAGKALRLMFPDCDFTIDLVPAFEHNDGYVLIGDRHEGTWSPSNARIQLKKISDRNQQTGGRFVHQVREIKAITKHQSDLRFITGIVIESLAYAIIQIKGLDKNAVAATLGHAARVVSGPIVEPGGDDDVTVKWTTQERATAVRVYVQLARHAEDALKLEQDGDVHAAIDLWHLMAGDDFPEAPKRSVVAAMTAWGSGSVTDAGRPTTSRVARQQAAPGRAWSSL